MNSHNGPDMKLDWNRMRVILAHIESVTIKEFLNDANSLSEWKEGQLLSDRRDQKQDPSVRVVYSHIKLLAKGDYIEGLHVQESLDGFFDIGISANPSLTLNGYALLGRTVLTRHRATLQALLERFAVASLQNKLEAAKKRVEAAAKEDEFGGTQFPEEVQHILTDDLENPLTEVRT